MESHISQIKALYDEGDDVSRARIKEAPHDLINTFEGPMGLMWQTFGSVSNISPIRYSILILIYCEVFSSCYPPHRS